MSTEKPMQLNNQDATTLLKQEELKMYYYRIIHDIKAPISSIIGLVRLSKIKIKDKESQDFLNEIETHFRQLETELFSSLKNGVFCLKNPESDVIDFNQVLDEVMKLLTYSKQMSKVHFHRTVKQNRYFKINRQLIFSILQNLIDNSIKHGRASDDQDINIYINLKQLKRSMKIEIADDGVGISEDTKKKLFENVHSSNDLLFKANGLGLYIIKKTVENLNGDLSIESIHGKGTKFSIFIPEAI